MPKPPKSGKPRVIPPISSLKFGLPKLTLPKTMPRPKPKVSKPQTRKP
jgi:hypothetical protein